MRFTEHWYDAYQLTMMVTGDNLVYTASTSSTEVMNDKHFGRSLGTWSCCMLIFRETPEGQPCAALCAALCTIETVPISQLNPTSKQTYTDSNYLSHSPLDLLFIAKQALSVDT